MHFKTNLLPLLEIIRAITPATIRAVALLMLLAMGAVHAHDIPADVRLNIFFKPEGKTLKLLIRAPLSAMRDVDIPTFGKGYLQVSKADQALRNATKLWLIDNQIGRAHV